MWYRVALTAAIVTGTGALACSGSNTGKSAPTGIIGIVQPGGGAQGGGGGGGSGSADTVHIGNNFYTPAAITVPPGATVTWIWTLGAVTHTVTDNADTTIRSPFQSSGTYQRTFNTTGSFPYHCSVHGFAMSGMVTVQ